MSKVENTDKNREKLAEAIVDNMTLKDMFQALYEEHIECFEKCEDTFQELWNNYYGDDDLLAGDEVYWNDPDADACSGHGVFVRYHADGVAVIIKDDVEIEVFIKELSQMPRTVAIYLEFDHDDVDDAEVYNYLNELMENGILNWEMDSE